MMKNIMKEAKEPQRILCSLGSSLEMKHSESESDDDAVIDANPNR